MAVEIKVEGVNAVIRNLERVEKRLLEKADRAIQNFALAVESQTVDNITAGGVPFTPLSPSTLEQKLKAGYSPVPLVRTGFMRQMVRSEKTGEAQAQVSVAADYAASHELGAPSAGITERPFLRPAVAMKLPQLQIAMKELKKG